MDFCLVFIFFCLIGLLLVWSDFLCVCVFERERVQERQKHKFRWVDSRKSWGGKNLIKINFTKKLNFFKLSPYCQNQNALWTQGPESQAGTKSLFFTRQVSIGGKQSTVLPSYAAYTPQQWPIWPSNPKCAVVACNTLVGTSTSVIGLRACSTRKKSCLY